MVWHLDVGLSFPKSVGSLIGGSAHPVLALVVNVAQKDEKKVNSFHQNG